MAFNDLLLANISLSRYQDGKITADKYIKDGATMYFVRLQIGHLHEALKIVKDFKDCSQLHNSISSGNKGVINAYNKLCQYIEEGSNYRDFQKYFGLVRNNLSFHYHDNGKWIKEALKNRIRIKKQATSRITYGELEDTRFELADQIVDSIVCRHIFNIPYEVDLEKNRKELDRILKLGSDIGRAFLVFVGGFMYHYSDTHLGV